MAASYNQTGGSVSIGRILSRTFTAIAGSPGVMLVIAFLFGALPQTALDYYQQVMASPARAVATDPGSAIAIVLLVALASMVFNLIVQGSLVGATMTEIEGDHATLGAAIDGRFE